MGHHPIGEDFTPQKKAHQNFRSRPNWEDNEPFKPEGPSRANAVIWDNVLEKAGVTTAVKSYVSSSPRSETKTMAPFELGVLLIKDQRESKSFKNTRVREAVWW